MSQAAPDQAEDLVPSSLVCDALDIERSTLTRWVDRGIAKPVQKLPGKNGAYLFAASEIARLRELRGDRKQMRAELNA